jgi:hypothetical protein
LSYIVPDGAAQEPLMPLETGRREQFIVYDDDIVTHGIIAFLTYNV